MTRSSFFIDDSVPLGYNREKTTEKTAMDEKALNKLSIVELQSLLLAQQQELSQLREQLQVTQAQLAERQLAVEEAGSIAQAALQLSGIFENAQQAADQYLENVASLHARQEADYLQRLAEADQQAQQLLQAAQQQCSSLEQQAQTKADYYWDVLSDKIARLYRESPELLQKTGQTAAAEDDICFGPDD